jgi:hypothetical protein
VWDVKAGRLLRRIADDGDAISPDARLVASRGASAIRLRQTEDGKLLRTILWLRGHKYAVLSPDGHFRGTPDVGRELVYVVQTDTGQETLPPADFATRYGWKNDPDNVGLDSHAGTPKPEPQESQTR